MGIPRLVSLFSFAMTSPGLTLLQEKNLADLLAQLVRAYVPDQPTATAILQSSDPFLALGQALVTQQQRRQREQQWQAAKRESRAVFNLELTITQFTTPTEANDYLQFRKQPRPKPVPPGAVATAAAGAGVVLVVNGLRVALSDLIVACRYRLYLHRLRQLREQLHRQPHPEEPTLR